MKSSKIAVIGPRSFSYLETITELIEKKGIETQFFDERFANTVITKILYRLGLIQKFSNYSNRHFDGLVQKITGGGYTHALLISVEVCDRRFVEMLRDAGVKVILYMWDSSKNKGRYIEYIDLLHATGSFEPDDCMKYAMQYIPLFAEEMYSVRSNQKKEAIREIDISFCGTLHSNRAIALSALLKVARERNLRIELWLFFHAKWILYIKGLLQPAIWKLLPLINTTGYKKTAIANQMFRSKYIFDMGHPDQKGMTARTFEALRSGARLITNNKAALELPMSLASRVIYINETEELVSKEFKEVDCPMLTQEEDYFLSIDRFINDLLKLINQSKNETNF